LQDRNEEDDKRIFSLSRILLQDTERQGKDAPGGSYDYVVDGKMIAGFALVAYPAMYGFRITTFIVDKDGIIYQKIWVRIQKRLPNRWIAITLTLPGKKWIDAPLIIFDFTNIVKLSPNRLLTSPTNQQLMSWNWSEDYQLN